MSTQDSRGWEQLQGEIYLCPNCIYNSQACQDLVKEQGAMVEYRLERLIKDKWEEFKNLMTAFQPTDPNQHQIETWGDIMSMSKSFLENTITEAHLKGREIIH